MNIEDIKKGEHETIEYKSDIPEVKEKYLKTVSAFANCAGGRLVFGVQDKTWEILGFSNEELFSKMDASQTVSMIRVRLKSFLMWKFKKQKEST